MRLSVMLLLGWAVTACGNARPERSAAAAPGVRITIATSAGTIEALLDSAAAPATVANFLRYVADSAFDGGQFHRTVRSDNQPLDSVRIGVVQASADTARHSYPPIPIEPTNQTGLHHLDGTLSMARGGPNTATSSFFICIGDQPSLDYGGHRNADGLGFAAFGRVTKGMDVVRAIQAAPAEGQALRPPVRILRLRRAP